MLVFRVCSGKVTLRFSLGICCGIDPDTMESEITDGERKGEGEREEEIDEGSSKPTGPSVISSSSSLSLSKLLSTGRKK